MVSLLGHIITPNLTMNRGFLFVGGWSQASRAYLRTKVRRPDGLQGGARG